MTWGGHGFKWAWLNGVGVDKRVGVACYLVWLEALALGEEVQRVEEGAGAGNRGVTRLYTSLKARLPHAIHHPAGTQHVISGRITETS